MTRNLKLAVVLLVITASAHADDPPWTKKQMTADLRQAADVVKRCWAYADYRKKEFGIDPDAVAAEFIGRLDTVKTRRDCFHLFEEFVARLEDGHASARLTGTLPARTRKLPLVLLDAREGLLVRRVHPSAKSAEVRVGDRVVAVDGKSLEEMVASRMKRVSASTAGARRLWALRWLQVGPKQVELTLEGAAGKTRRVKVDTVPVWEKFFRPDKGDWLTWKKLDGDIGHMRLTTFYPIDHAAWKKAHDHDSRAVLLAKPQKRVKEAFRAVADTKALILDLRDNGGGTDQFGQFVAQQLIKGLSFTYFWLSTRYSPELAATPSWKRFYPKGDMKTTGWSPEGKHGPKFRLRRVYRGRLVVLINEACFSVTDNFCACLRDLHPDVRFVGRPTGAGTGGAREMVKLTHSKVSIRFCTQHVRSPKKRVIEGRGTQPDVTVKWTRADLLGGVDADLAAALRALRD